MPPKMSIRFLNWRGRPEEVALVKVAISGWFSVRKLPSSNTVVDGE